MTGQPARLGKAQEGCEGFLHGVERLVGTKSLTRGETGEAARVLPGKAIDPAHEAWALGGLTHGSTRYHVPRADPTYHAAYVGSARLTDLLVESLGEQRRCLKENSSNRVRKGGAGT